jgi:predicted GNAT superfamily acetyltransferase
MEIRKLSAFQEYEDCVELQRLVWEFSDRDLMPARYLKVTQIYGGSVLGAFENNRLIAFAFAQPSIHQGRLAWHSNILAVHPDSRNRGIGEALKLEQRKDALGHGIDLITWTYDPLQARNAYLNLNKLGVIVRNYICDLYGSASSSSLHSGLGTDRVEAEWWLSSPRVLSCVEKMPDEKSMPWIDENRLPHLLLRLEIFGNGCQSLISHGVELSVPEMALEIPVHLTYLMSSNLKLAQEWRSVSRELLMRYFSRGYQISRLARVVASNSKSHSSYRTFCILEACENRTY